MPRVSYVSTEPDFASPKDKAILDRIRQRRGSDGLLELDRMLLHAPPVAGGWNELLGAIRSKTIISDDVREIIICRVAALNQAQYEWDQHAPLLKSALQSIIAQSSLERSDDTETSRDALAVFMAALRDPASDDFAKLKVPWAEKHKKLVQYVDSMTKDVVVSDDTFRQLRESLPDGNRGQREMVEITATCASYNCVSRFLVALHIGDVTWNT